MSRRPGLVWILAVALAGSPTFDGRATAQPPSALQPTISSPTGSSVEPSGETVVLEFFNRPIVPLRGRVLGRGPQDRALAAERILDDLVAQHITGPVETQPIEGAVVITVASRGVLVLTAADVDTLLGESLQGVAAQTVSRLQEAIAAAVEGTTPGRLLRSAVLALLGLTVGLLVLWAVSRIHRMVSGKLAKATERRIAETGIAHLQIVQTSRLFEFERWLLRTGILLIDLVVVYATVTFILRRFPYTSPWGLSMRDFFVSTIENLALGILSAVPGLFTILLVVLLARFAVRLINLVFNAIERGRIHVRWIYPETAQPTRRLMIALLWLFAIVAAYPYFPGSETDAFKGVSVFLGLLVTFGSSGLVNQIMSGFMVTYSRALRVGDFVRIGDVEGTVTHLGVLSTKIKTVWHEEVTVPHAVVVAQTTIDYSRLADSEGVFTPTSVTIGYDAPWRQVQSLLLLAAARTPGVRKEPKPVVLQMALEDFYVRYTLYICLERQEDRFVTLDALHAHIQDLFNEHGVQIMSPNYMLDPAAPKIVPRKNWYATPAAPEQTVPVPTDRALP